MEFVKIDPVGGETLLRKYLSAEIMQRWWPSGTLAPEDLARAFHGAAKDFIQNTMSLDDFVIICTYLYWEGFVRYKTLRPPGIEPDAIRALQMFSDLPNPKHIDLQTRTFLEEVVARKSRVEESR